MKEPVRTSSSIIGAYIQTKQEIEIDSQSKLLRQAEIIKNDRCRNRLDDVKPKSSSSKQKTKHEEEVLKKSDRIRSMDDHRIPLVELFKRLETDPEKGLAKDVADYKNSKIGDNVLVEKMKTPWYVKLLKEFCNTFAIMLWVASILSFMVYGLTPYDPSNLYLGIVLAAIVVVSGICSFYQSYKSEAIMQTFKNFVPLKVRVVRDGSVRNILAAKLVPGDIVLVKEGDRIPADLRVINSAEMRVDNSSLTGESDPLIRSVECTDPDNPLETKNLCFFGTMCKEGCGRGVVINIGENTAIGQIADLAASTGSQPTILQKEIDRFIGFIAIIASTMGLFFFGIGFAVGYPILTNVLFAIGLLVGNAPEGLLITITVSLTLRAKALARKMVLVKNLQTVETLGATTTICSDKTGTLTQNKMTVENLWYDGKIVKGINLEKFKREKAQYHQEITLEYDVQCDGFRTLQDVALLSSEAIFDLDAQDDKAEKNKGSSQELVSRRKNSLLMNKKVIGDASETALIVFFQPIEDILETRLRNPIVVLNGNECRIPFNSMNKFVFSIVHEEDNTKGSHYTLVMKGAPERVWRFCKSIMIEGEEQPINEQWVHQFEEANMYFATNGQRVLGFAKMCLDPKIYKRTQQPDGSFTEYPFNTSTVNATYPDYKEWNFPINELTFVGLISLIDPPRDGVPFSILKCKAAGIKVIMVTGDQPITAQAIAKQVNILDSTVKTNLDLEKELKISSEEAIMRAQAIVIHGDLITKALSEDSLLAPEERGKSLEYWLSKPNIVFSRTSPSQKLVIVKGCQARGEVVAVTGDGVNDSPAIKKADVGIAMGLTGSDVAIDAADLVLMTDDFSAIVVGIQEGRKLYDNLKKAVSYSLTTNVPEVMPYVLLIIFGFPVPITTILMLFLCNGTDICPAISLAYEESELDIMARKPRDRHEHLLTRKLLTFCYIQIGIFETFGCFLSFFTVFADFGFPFFSVFELGLKTGFAHNPGDIYDQYAPDFGNSNLIGACQGTDQLANGQISNYAPDWYLTGDVMTELRMVYVSCAYDASGQLTGGVTSTLEYWPCAFRQISPVSHKPVCFTTEAGKHAQTAFFVSIVLSQCANILIHKTRRESIYHHNLSNYFQMWGITFEIIICLALVYIPGLNYGLNTRDLTFLHFGTPALPFTLFILLYNEIRIHLILRSVRNKKDTEKPGWWWRNYCW